MKVMTRIAVLAMFALIVGCAITDWAPMPGHRTTGEAKLYTKEVGWSNTGYPDLDGTYAFTAKYDMSTGALLGGIYIYTYRNPVLLSWTRDGQFNEDGDYIQGHSGVLGGKYLPQWTAIDYDVNTCGFFSNITFDKTSTGPGYALCFTPYGGIYYAENDRDYEIHGEYANFDQLLNGVWHATSGAPMELDIVGIRFDQTTRPITTFPATVRHNATMPYSIAFTPGEGMRSAIQTVLDNTENMTPVNLGVVLAGGLTYDSPGRMKVAFNHDALRKVLNALNNPVPAPAVHKKYR